MTCPHCMRLYVAAQKGDSCGGCNRLLVGEPVLTRPVPVLCMKYRDAGEEPAERQQP